MLQITNILAYISFLSVLIPIFFLLKKKDNFKIGPINMLGILLFVSAASDLTSIIMIKTGRPSAPISNTFILIQFFLLNWIYHYLLNNKKVVYIFFILFIGFFIINTLFIQSFNEFQGWTRFAAGIIMLIHSISYYRQILKATPPIGNLFDFYPFWLNTAIYFYFALNLFLFAMSNYIFKNLPKDTSLTYWGFHNFNNVMKNLLFAVAIYVSSKALVKNTQEEYEYDFDES